MKKPLIAVAALAVLALVVWASLRESSGRGTAVEVEKATRRTISSRVKATGEITPERKVAISAKVVGEIIELPVREGDEVRSGQLLVEIERDLYVAARNQARAARQQAEVSSRRLEVQLEDAERTLRRTSELHGQGLASQQQLDTAQVNVDSTKVELQAQRHAVEQYASALKRAEDDLARTTIRSPMDGIIIQLDAEKGETVVPGTTNLPGSVIMTIADMSRLLAEVEVSEVDVVDVVVGQEAEVKVDALGDEPLKGHVVEIATSGRKDPAQGTIRFKVKVVLDDRHPALRPTMTAKVSIFTAVAEEVVAVPIQAVVKRKLDQDSGKELRGSAGRGVEEQEVVYLLEEGEATIRPVSTGISDDLFVEITDGLDDGEEIVVGPYRTLKDLHSGDSIRPEEGDEEGDEDDDGAEVEVRMD
jgi:HlyD family secretion protein